MNAEIFIIPTRFLSALTEVQQDGCTTIAVLLGLVNIQSVRFDPCFLDQQVVHGMTRVTMIRNDHPVIGPHYCYAYMPLLFLDPTHTHDTAEWLWGEMEKVTNGLDTAARKAKAAPFN